MSTINFDQLVQNLESGVETLAKSSLTEYEQAAKTDGINAIDNMKSNLQVWSQAVANGSLTFEDLGFLLKAEESLNEMTALKEAGLAEVRIDEFKVGLVNVITGGIASAIKV